MQMLFTVWQILLRVRWTRVACDALAACLVFLMWGGPGDQRYRVTIKCGPVVWFDDYATSHIVITMTNGPTWRDARGREWSVQLQSPTLLTNRLL